MLYIFYNIVTDDLSNYNYSAFPVLLYILFLEAFFPSLTFRAGIHRAPKGKGFGAFLQIRVSYGGPLIFSLSFLCFNYIRLKGICQEFFYFFSELSAFQITKWRVAHSIILLRFVAPFL